jgi:heme a synthase
MNRFQKWALVTTIATYILITVGGFVRASGAGLGCPDWPTCFGKPYPPFSIEELRERDVPADFDIEAFDVRLAWIEYFNRLSGSVIGLLLIVTTYLAYRDHRRTARILYPTLAAFLTVLINGWMGSQVVESELEPIVITIHLVLALLQVCLLLYATVSAFYPQGGLPAEELPRSRHVLARGALFVLFLALIQVSLGADLRGQLQVAEEENPEIERGDIIHHADWVDIVHRSFSWTILLGVGGLFYYANQRMEDDAAHPWLRYGTTITGGLVIAQILAGIGLAYGNLPPPLQLAHVVLASLLIGSLMTVYLLATRLPIPEKAAQQSGQAMTPSTVSYRNSGGGD